MLTKIDKDKKTFYSIVDLHRLETPALWFWILSYPSGFQNHRIQDDNPKMLSEHGNIKLKRWVSFLHVSTFLGTKLETKDRNRPVLSEGEKPEKLCGSANRNSQKLRRLFFIIGSGGTASDPMNPLKMSREHKNNN